MEAHGRRGCRPRMPGSGCQGARRSCAREAPVFAMLFQDDNGQVRTMTLQQGRDTHVLEGRWLVIVAVQI